MQMFGPIITRTKKEKYQRESEMKKNHNKDQVMVRNFEINNTILDCLSLQSAKIPRKDTKEEK